MSEVLRSVVDHRRNAPARWSLRALLFWLLIAGCQHESCSEAQTLPARRQSDTLAFRDTPQAEAPRAELEDPKVVFLGDSITAGMHLEQDQAFPAVLQRELRARGTSLQVVNAGVSGDTSAGGRRRVDWLLKQKPDLVVVELGGNDGLRGVPLESIEQNLRAILLKIQKAGAKTLLLGMRLPPSHGSAYTEAFSAIYPRLGSELGVPVVPFFMKDVAGVPDLNLSDGLHPTAEGHRILARRLAEPVLRMLP